ncbi:HsdM family class I SAM-dependent methyltransferase [Helicobacter cetorum]|uniref:HsdM family class I SAM-dependent methyltransferase n=1 Tax=Helicobacter cetorum TaxID=138563 RepID=UPI0018C8C586|nr:N-6 DNA methylase [Helicobacter cetorum]
MLPFKLEDDINDYIKEELENLGLIKNKDFNIEGKMSDSLKNALKNASKTESKASFGRPDFSLEIYHAKGDKENIIPIVIENKLYSKFLKSLNSKDSTIKSDEKSIKDYAVNGALYYAKSILRDKDKYKECIAIGVAGDNRENIAIEVYYVFASGANAHKLTHVTNLHFLENQKSFDDFYKECTLTESEKALILFKTKIELSDTAKKLNRLMHNHNITAPQRVLYVSGMLLSMQEIKGVKEGLKPSDLKGELANTSRDSILVFNQIKEFLKAKGLNEDKRDLMLSSFKEIAKDPQRDNKTSLDKAISTQLTQHASITKQIFSFLYEFVHKPINESDNTGHLDIIGELYSEFLKYALGDGKELGIVLTPPYVTKMMSELLGVNANSYVMDLAAGSAGFLISSMVLMIENIEKTYGKNTSKAKEKIESMKKSQLLGVELNAEMFSLATTNMILRGDGSSLIIKGNTFETSQKIYEDFKPNILLLNPPFSYEENGMPFIKFGLDCMQKGGLGAIIIQDSAGSGQALKSNKEILKKHSLLASIKMPTDLFMPMAGVQTSIYIFKAHEAHDYERLVKFIDFRNDGFKRTKRGLNEISEPNKRYEEIIKIYKAGLKAEVSKELWGDLENIYIEDFIAKEEENKHAKDFNFEAHQKNETKPTLEDFKKTISDYLAYEVSLILKSQTPPKL